MRECRAGQMSLNRRQHGRVARLGAEFRAGQCFHGLDKRRQPSHFAFSGAPLLGLLGHHVSRLKPPLSTRRLKTGSLSLREKRPGKCDLVHKPADLPSLNRCDDPESIPTFVRTADRCPPRLRADCDQRCRGPDRADLPHPVLTGLEAIPQRSGTATAPSSTLGARASDKVQLRGRFFDFSEPAPDARLKTRQASRIPRPGFIHILMNV